MTRPIPAGREGRGSAGNAHSRWSSGAAPDEQEDQGQARYAECPDQLVVVADIVDGEAHDQGQQDDGEFNQHFYSSRVKTCFTATVLPSGPVMRVTLRFNSGLGGGSICWPISAMTRQVMAGSWSLSQ